MLGKIVLRYLEGNPAVQPGEGKTLVQETASHGKPLLEGNSGRQLYALRSLS